MSCHHFLRVLMQSTNQQPSAGCSSVCFLAVLVLIPLIPSYPTGKNEWDSINFQP